jgi:sugar lactone lactonase YvrE
MRRVKLASAALGLTIGVLAAIPASAFERGLFTQLAKLPALAGQPGVRSSVEGIAAGADGNIYAVSSGVNTQTGVPVPNPPSPNPLVPNVANLFIISTGGSVTARQITGVTPALLGLAFAPALSGRTGGLLVVDSGSNEVFELPTAGSGSITAQLVMTIPAANRDTAFLNAITFDAGGRIYVSDSRNGIIWTAQLQPNMSVEATNWIGGATTDPEGLLAPPVARGGLAPVVGANGIAFSNSGGRMLVANTGFRNIIQIPVTGNPPVPDPTRPLSIFVSGINGPDGIAVQTNPPVGTPAGRIWVTANQSDEIVVIDNVTGRVIQKLGDFFGLEAGSPNGLLFPANLAFSIDGGTVYVANFANPTDTPACPLCTPPTPFIPGSIDSDWTRKVTTYNVVKATTAFNPPIFP